MRFGIIGNLEKSGLREAVTLLLGQLENSGMDYLLEERILPILGDAAEGPQKTRCAGMEECVSKADILVAFGGDGTILAAARAVGGRGTPILGVNLGKLGFLAEVAPEEMHGMISDIIAEKFVVEDRLVLEATSPALPGRTLHAINDLVVDKSRSPRLIDIETYIDGAFAVTYRGDGLIISTPTGSTAYALSNGGPIVTPMSGVIGITPISPHTLSGRPLIVPDTTAIRVVVRAHTDEVLLSSDGQVEAFLKPPAELAIRKAGYSLRLVKRVDRSYFDVLRAKLLWGQDPRSTGSG
jgi:NAD+ kinase